MFEEGIHPTWEDPVNSVGADFSLNMKMNADTLKTVWEKLVYACLFEKMDSSKWITGCRIVNKEN